MKNISKLSFFTVAIFLLIFFISNINLNADTSFLKRTGDVDDEAQYAHNARTAALFGEWAADEFVLGIAVTPLYSYATYLVFILLGVGYAQLRLLSVISGLLILIMLYFFMKQELRRKYALFTILFLGFSYIFFMHIRIGRPENMMMLFLLSTFYLWYLGLRSDKRVFYFVSGVTCILAFLTKFVAIFTFPAFIVFWLFLFIRKEIKIRDIILFISGGLGVFLIYFIFYLIPNWNIIIPFFLKVTGNNLFFPIYNTFWFFSTNFYGQIPAFIIFLCVVFYFINFLSKSGSLVDKIKLLSIIELVSISWIIGASATFIIGDMSERRFFTLLIPMAVLASKFILDGSLSFKKSIDAIHSKLEEKSFLKTSAIYLIMLLPIFSLLYTLLFMISINKEIFSFFQSLILISYLVVSIVLTLMSQHFSINKSLLSLFTIASFSALIILPLSTVVRHLVRHALTILEKLEIELLLGIGITTILSLILVSCLLLSYFYKGDIIIGKKTISLLLVIFVVVNTLVIGQAVFKPSYSVYNASIELRRYTVFEDVTISDLYLDYLLSYENGLHPYWYFPFNYSDATAYSDLHSNIIKYNPKLIIRTELYDGKKPPFYDEWFDSIGDLKDRAKFVKNIYLFPYPFTNKSKIVLSLYEVEEQHNKSVL